MMNAPLMSLRAKAYESFRQQILEANFAPASSSRSAS